MKKNVWAICCITALIIILYFSLRLLTIKTLPMFVDEAIYVRWAQMGFFDPASRFSSLSDGKQPLFIWLTSITMHFIANPITAGRVVSISLGFGTGIGLFILSYELFRKKWAGIITALLYSLYPFSLIIDRMALYESTISFFFIFSLYVGVLLTKKLQTQYAFMLGFLLGGGILTKTTGFMSIYLFPLFLFVADFPKTKLFLKTIIWILLFLLSFTVAFILYSILLLSVDFQQIGIKNDLFVYAIHDLIPKKIYIQWIPNSITLLTWIWQYFTPVVSIFFLISLITVRKNFREKIFLGLWFLIPFLAYGLFAKDLNPRYIYSITLPLLVLFGISILHMYSIKSLKYIAISAAILSIISMGYSDYKIIYSFANAPIPDKDLAQYINGPFAGGGIKEAIAYLREKANTGKILIATEGTYGSLPTTAVDMYFTHHPNVLRTSFDPKKKLPTIITENSNIMPIYFITNYSQKKPKWPMTLIASYQKGNSNLYLRLYKFTPKPQKNNIH